jgi:hypothetical protein
MRTPTGRAAAHWEPDRAPTGLSPSADGSGSPPPGSPADPLHLEVVAADAAGAVGGAGAAPAAPAHALSSPCHLTSSCTRLLPHELARLLYPPQADLTIGVASYLPQSHAFRRGLAWCTLLASLALLAFSLWFWFTPANMGSFWRMLAQLTNWALFLTFVYGLLTAFIVLQEEYFARALGTPWGFTSVSFRVSANVHLWPAVFALNAVVVILFWSGASQQSVLSTGAIPAHLIFPLVLIHAALYAIPVLALGFIPVLVTGLLYLLVTGIYTAANGGQGPYAPSSLLNWQTGLTAAVVFVGLAIVLVAHALLFAFSFWRDGKRLRQGGAGAAAAAPPPPAAAELPLHVN